MAQAFWWSGRPFVRKAALCSLLALGAGGAQAIGIDTGDSGIDIRWDTALRYNVGMRIDTREPKIYNNVNYDESDGKFEQADVVDFTRKVPMNTTFGNGPHRCPGSYLARVELKVLLQEWLPRIADFRLKAGDPPQVRTGINGRFARLALEWMA